MRVGQTLRPGQKGTRRYVDRYGDRLVCVRYRYDESQRRRFTTVELVVEDGEWAPTLRPETVVAVHVAWGEKAVAARIKREGGEWDPGRKRWLLRYDAVVRLGAEGRAQTLHGHQVQRPSLHVVTGL